MKRKKLAWNCSLVVVCLIFIGVPAEAQSLKFSRDSLTFDAQAVGISSSDIQITLSNVDDKNPVPRQYHTCLKTIDFSPLDLRDLSAWSHFCLRCCVCFFRHKMSGKSPSRTSSFVSSWQK